MNELFWILVWWLQSTLLMVITLPLAWRVFSFLPDKGLGLARIFGLMLVSYTIWLAGFIHYSPATIALAWAALAAGSWLVWRREGKAIRAFLSANSGLVLVYEALFFMLLVFWAFVRMRHPEIVDQEKFMDFAFFNAFRHESRFPPFDPWLAGAKNYINYYYFGYLSMSSFARLSGVDPAVGYNLVIALLYALTGCGIFSLGYNLTKRLLPAFAGLALLQVLGNLDGAVQLLQNGWRGIDWWRPTRLIHDVVSGGAHFNAWWDASSPAYLAAHGLAADAARDACISEFPYFTFLHGDMHPHLVAMPFALLALGLALALLKSPWPGTLSLKPFRYDGPWPYLALALCLGCLTMMNTWDLPAYGLTASLALLLHQHRAGRLRQHWLQGWLLPSAGLLLLTLLFASPFLAFFKAPAKGIGFTAAKTGLKDTLVFWGAFLAVLAPFVAFKLSSLGRALALGRALPLYSVEALPAKPAAAGKAALAGKPAKAKLKLKPAQDACPKCQAKVRAGNAFCGQCGAKMEAAEPAAEPPAQALAAAKPPALAARLLTIFAKPSKGLSHGPAALLFWAWALSGLALLILMPTTGLLWLLLGAALLLLYSRADEPEGLFALAALAVGLSFILAVEWLHLRDTFEDNPVLVRMNTVFKFYFAAWILLSAAAPLALHQLERGLAAAWGKAARLAVLALVGLALLAGLAYPVYATRGVWDNYDAFSNLPPTLDGMAWLKRDNPDDAEVILRMRDLPGAPVVAEAVGGEYTHFARVSSFTGLPCPVGWPGHELQWRNSYPGVAQQDMDTLYSTMDPAVAQGLIAKYDIRYVFVGALERQKYAAAALAKFDGFMDRFITSNSTVLYARRG